MEINEETEYEKDGMIYCKKCNQPLLFIRDNFVARVSCECQQKEWQKQQEQKKAEENMKRFAKLQELSLIGKRYQDVNFESCIIQNDSFKNALQIAKEFCRDIEAHISSGTGLFLYGGVGLGKTHLMACILNTVLKRYIPCLFTNIMEIMKVIGADFQYRKEFLNHLTTIPVLFIDDFGTERVKTNGEDNWVQEYIYDIVNTRYNNKLPTIYSSNYSLKQLLEVKGMMQKTIDRIFQTTQQVKFEGQSFRVQK